MVHATQLCAIRLVLNNFTNKFVLYNIMSLNNVLTKSRLINYQFRRFAATTEKPKNSIPNVKGLSSNVILANPPPERVKKATKNGPYKNPQYFSYHKNSYFNAEVEMLKYRLPQPSSLK